MTRSRGQTTRAGWAGWASTVAVLALLASGCAINGGSAKAQQFEQDWAEEPDVASVTTTSTNDLPFTGTADGTVTVVPGTPDDRVTELLHELGEYVSDHNGVRAELVAGDFALGVRATREGNDQVVALWQALDERPDVSGAELSSTETVVRLGEADDFGPFVDDFLTDGRQLAPLPGTSADVVAGTTDEPAVVSAVLEATAQDGETIDDAIAAYHAVDDRYGVVDALLSRTEVTLRVPRSSDVPAALDVAESAAPSIATGIVVDGGTITHVAPGAGVDEESVAVLLEGDDAVAGVDVSPGGVTAHVPDLDAAAGVERAVAKDPAAAALDRVSVVRYPQEPGSGPGPDDFWLSVAGHDRGELTVADALAVWIAAPTVDSIRSTDRGVEMTLDDPTEDDVAALARELAARVDAGTPVAVRSWPDVDVSFVAGPHPDPDPVAHETSIPADVFIEAWEDAWP